METKIDGNVPLLVFDNHDNPRLDARYGDGVHNADIERVISTILFASRGASLFYYGDEIGMKTTPPTRKEDVKDPVGMTGWPKEKGRDGERTPMQWDTTSEAGFTTAVHAVAAGSAHLHHRQREGRGVRSRLASRLVQGPDPPQKDQSCVGAGRPTSCSTPTTPRC